MQLTRSTTNILSLLAALTLIPSCSDGERAGLSLNSEPAAPTEQPLRNGTDVGVERMKGVVEVANVNDGTRCTGLLLNDFSILTTAHCAARLVRPGERDFQHEWGFTWNTYTWTEETGYRKHCWSEVNAVCAQGLAGLGKIEDKDVHFFSLSMSPDNDLAIFSRSWYPLQADTDDFADIYLDEITPASTPRLQLYSWGMLGNGINDPLLKPRTGTMRVVETTPGHVKLTADQVQSCSGDEGGPWTIPGGADPSQNAAVALVSRFQPGSNGCSAVNGTEYAVRLANKAAWIQSVDSSCVQTVNNAGHNVLRCTGYSCNKAPPEKAGWDGCRGSGCAVCSDVIDSYPKYFDHHRNCTRNATCAGEHYRCSEQCPPPTAADL